MADITVGLIGASGYTGADFLRLAAAAPGLRIGPLAAEASAGRLLADVFPHLAGLGPLGLEKADAVNWSACDIIVSGLPHGAAQDVIAQLPDVKIVDMSADFRLRDSATYAQWYGRSHDAPGLLAEAVYGLTEHNRSAVTAARLVACPGCYPTAALLALIPPVAAGLLDTDGLVIDAKSGVSGAGRGLKQNVLFAEAGEGISPYGIASHRHAPEIEQELSRAAGYAVAVTFTPHLVPMSRGELVTCYARLAPGATAADVRAVLVSAYDGEAFVRLPPEGHPPATQMVRGSNLCLVDAFADRVPGRVIVIAAIDNLVKGSAGQALQNLNLMTGRAETAGLGQLPLFP